MPDPNGLCFSPDYKKLYVVSTGKGPGDTGPGGKGDVYVFDVGTDNKLTNGKRFTDFMIDGVKCGPDGIRADVDGNSGARAMPAANVGYSGVTCGSPRASCSAASACPRCAATSPSAAPSATGCSWRRASRSTRSIPRHAGRGAGVAIFCRGRATPWRVFPWSSGPRASCALMVMQRARTLAVQKK